MSNLLQMQLGTKVFGTKQLFERVNFSINEGEHVGVIGPNGAGKSTLFRILAEQDTLDSGQVVKAKNLRLGYLAQHDEWQTSDTVEDYLSRGVRMPLWDLKALGRGLGLSDDLYVKQIVSLSGGYRMRCKLLYLLGQEPNLMLLDEPTNYLDLETTLVLEEFLQGFRGAFLLISHDREFLRRTTDHILEVEQGDITKFNGNIDDYFEQKALLRTQLEARAMSVAEKRQEILRFVDRFGAKASKARQAQSRLKSLSKMEAIEVKPLPVSAHIRLPVPVKAGKVILKLEGVDLGYGEKVVLRNVRFQLHNGDHVAVVGLNGAGKSTLLKVLAQVLKPLQGSLEVGHNVCVAYFAQHVAESLNPEHTVLEAMMSRAHPDVLRQEALDMAGSLLFSGDDTKKKVAVLSGGEKSRVALGQILLEKAPCLVLDEPTNHLDFQTVEALSQALVNYSGTLVVVSHDRSFIRRVGSVILEVNHGEVHRYPGTYDEFVWSLQKGVLAERPGDSVKASDKRLEKKVEQSPQESRDRKKELERQLRRAERRLAELDFSLPKLAEQRTVLNEKISDSAPEAIAILAAELGAVQASIEAEESEWLELSEERERLAQEVNDFYK